MNASRRLAPLLLALWGMMGGWAAWGPSLARAQETTADPTAATDSMTVRRVSPLASTFPLMSKHAIGPIQLDTVEAQRFDNGRMWTFEAPPVAYFRKRYNFSPDSTWFRRARLGALRIPGCTASFASSHGLVLTNHHCGRDHATAVGRPGENILTNGFYASSLQEERRVPDLYADQLIAIHDVTQTIEAAVAEAQTDAERSAARQQAIERVRQRILDRRSEPADQLHIEVIPLYDGARYSAYVFRRYQDVRLVMIPELQMGYFGGDTDNFTYPRYALDMSLFRVYEDGAPLRTEHYFPWSTEGAQAGDAVFVVGNPGSTLRLETIAQLLFRRDVREPAVLHYLRSRADALQAYADAQGSASEYLQNQIFGLLNGVKLYRGRVKALRDPYIMARRRDAQQDFVDSIQAVPHLQQRFGGLVDSMAAIQQQKRDYASAFQAFLLLGNPNYSSATLQRALIAVQYLRQQAAGGGPRLDQLRQALLGVGTQPDGIDRRFLALRLQDFQQYFGANDSLVTDVLGGATPEAVASRILQNSVLADSAQAAEALAQGTLSMSDPAVQLVQAFMPQFQAYQSAWTGLQAQQQEVSRRLGQARYAIYGTSIPPDASFSLRIADGVVRSYEYNGTFAPVHTTFYGNYSHYASYGADSEWDLPEQWLNPPAAFEPSTPINLISTNDITGGNSGSPLLNKELEVVGLIFDGNIESLAGDYIFMPDQGMRAVSVDVRGMLEALRDIYEADRLVMEVTGGPFVESEAAADAQAATAQ